MFAVSSHKSTVAAWKAIYCEHKHVLYICYMQLATSLRQLLCYSRKFWNMVCTSLWNKMFCQECCWYCQYSSRQRATKCRVLPHLLNYFFLRSVLLTSPKQPVWTPAASSPLTQHKIWYSVLPNPTSASSGMTIPADAVTYRHHSPRRLQVWTWRHLTGAQAQGWEDYASKGTMPVIQKDDRMVWHYLGVQTPWYKEHSLLCRYNHYGALLRLLLEACGN